MHDRKGGGQVGESIRGSSAFAGACDLMLKLSRVDGPNQSLRKIEALGRLEAAPEKLVVELTDDGFISHGSETRIAVTKATSAVMALFRIPSHPTGSCVGSEFTEKEILEKLKPEGVSRKTLRLALEDLVRDGLLRRSGRGVKGDPHTYSPSKDSVPTPDPKGLGGISNNPESLHDPSGGLT
jgi:hypothetical protein